VGFRSPPRPIGQYQDSTLKLGHDHFPPNRFQFVIHLSPFHSTLYSFSYWKSVIEKLQINKYMSLSKICTSAFIRDVI
jgi:hypothetical protein